MKKRFNCEFPRELYDRLSEFAEKEQVTLIYLIRSFCNLGLFIWEAIAQGDIVILHSKDGTERRMQFFL